jgi:AcrR family transcriptional regulator
MQVLKDEVRNNILSAARSEFRKKGYLQASLRQIALEAGMTIGNIYHYYKNKEQLFDAIVQPDKEQYTAYLADIRERIQRSYASEEPNATEYFNNIEVAMTRLFKTYSTELTILLNQSKGSKYEPIKSDLVKLTFSLLESLLIKSRATGSILNTRDHALAQMLASTVVEGLCLILRDNDESQTIEHLVDQFLYLYSEGITAILTKNKIKEI